MTRKPKADPDAALTWRELAGKYGFFCVAAGRWESSRFEVFIGVDHRSNWYVDDGIYNLSGPHSNLRAALLEARKYLSRR